MAPRKPRPAEINKFWFLPWEIVGLGLSVYLFLVSAGLVNLPCPHDSIFACTSVVSGNFGHIGPFSVAAMGGVYFLAQLMLTMGLRERLAQIVKALLTAGGIVFIAWLRVVELIYLEKACLWCWGVAVVTLIHSGFVYAIMAPPLPKMKPFPLAGVVTLGFIVTIGLVAVLELSTGTGKKLEEWTKSLRSTTPIVVDSKVPVAQPDSKPAAKPDSKDTATAPRKTPAPTPRPTATPQATAAAVAPTPIIDINFPPSSNQTARATPTPSPTPQATRTAAAPLDPEPQLEDSDDVKILRARGWRHAGSSASVINAVKARPPVLLLAYDPHCPDCHRLITRTLNSDVMNSVPVTRIAIQQSMVSGQLDDMLKALPTMLLFDDDGTVLLTHVGSQITAQELANQIRSKLR